MFSTGRSKVTTLTDVYKSMKAGVKANPAMVLPYAGFLVLMAVEIVFNRIF